MFDIVGSHSSVSIPLNTSYITHLQINMKFSRCTCYCPVVSVICLAFQLEEPRQLGVRGQYLPSARFVSNKVHRGVGTEAGAPDVTLFLMQWGQFTDHDLVLTPIATGEQLSFKLSY